MILKDFASKCGMGAYEVYNIHDFKYKILSF